MDNIWLWIVVGAIIGFVLTLTVGSVGHKNKTKMDIHRRGGGKILKDYDEDQKYIDKYSR